MKVLQFALDLDLIGAAVVLVNHELLDVIDCPSMPDFAQEEDTRWSGES